MVVGWEEDIMAVGKSWAEDCKLWVLSGRGPHKITWRRNSRAIAYYMKHTGTFCRVWYWHIPSALNPTGLTYVNATCTLLCKV